MSACCLTGAAVLLTYVVPRRPGLKSPPVDALQEQQRVIRLLSALLRDAYGQPPSPSGHSDSMLQSVRPSLEVGTSLSPSTHFSEDISMRWALGSCF